MEHGQPQMPWSNNSNNNDNANDGYTQPSVYSDSNQYGSFHELFSNDADHNSFETSWNMNSAEYNEHSQSRALYGMQHQHQPSAMSNTPAGMTAQRSLSHSPSPYGQPGYHPYALPHNYPYWQQPQYHHPSLLQQQPYQQREYSFTPATYESSNVGTIAPQALQHESATPAVTHSQQTHFEPARHNVGIAPAIAPAPIEFHQPTPVDQVALLASIPKSKDTGYFSIIDFDDLAKATKSERKAAFLNIGEEPQEWNVTRAALPAYVPRKSRNDLKRLAANDPQLLARLSRKPVKPIVAIPKPLQSVQVVPLTSTDEPVKTEVEVSSEEESSSSSSEDDDSSYTSESDAEESPIPPKRPTDAKGAVEYDTIKALWRGKRKTLKPDSIRQGIVDFWEIIKTLRDRWKVDSTAVAEATEKNRKNEIPLLESRVKDQRDMMEAAFRAALKYGSRTIVELLASNASLVFLCYQFLLDRAKAEDYNSPLARALLETMSLFKTLSAETMERTHLVKVLPRYIKKGDAKTQFYAKRITAHAGETTTAVKQPPATDTATKAASDLTKRSSAETTTNKRPAPAPIAGVKRNAGSAAESATAKKPATGAAKASLGSPSTKANGTVKKITAIGDGSKPPTATPAATIKPKQIVAKPSGFFSGLQSAAKKPGTSIANKPLSAGAGVKPTERTPTAASTASAGSAPKSTFSFADTMAALSKPKEEKAAPVSDESVPAETAEQKTKRLRKEARRNLNVTFRPGDDLVQVRYFTHDPEEETGHDSSQMRDVSDVGGEGRMFKQQHQMMDLDEDDLIEDITDLSEYKPLSMIDFSVVDPQERAKNYAPYGGGTMKVQSPECAIRENHEANTLLVVYSSPQDIPPSPSEPKEPYSGDNSEPTRQFGLPEDKYIERVRQQPSVTPAVAPAFDLSKLASFATSLAPQPAAPAVPTSEALSNILASLRQNMASQGASQPQQAPANGFAGNAFPSANLFSNLQPQSLPVTTGPPPGQPDLASILATLKQQSSGYNAPSTQLYGQGSSNAMPYTTQLQGQMNNNVPGDAMDIDDSGKSQQQHPFWRTKTCIYWQQGKCQKGDACTYKHED